MREWDRHSCQSAWNHCLTSVQTAPAARRAQHAVTLQRANPGRGGPKTYKERSRAGRAKNKKPQPDGWGTVPYKNKSTTLVSALSSQFLGNLKRFRCRGITRKRDQDQGSHQCHPAPRLCLKTIHGPLRAARALGRGLSQSPLGGPIENEVRYDARAPCVEA